MTPDEYNGFIRIKVAFIPPLHNSQGGNKEPTRRDCALRYSLYFNIKPTRLEVLI